MNCIEIVLAVVNVLAIIIIPIVAVKVGQVLQDRAQARKDKMDVFKTLMVNRVMWSVSSVQALNIIDIVFFDDEVVRSCWKDYYEKLCIQEPDEMQQKQIQLSHYKLLEAMAVSLGYKDTITWETIQNPYIPKGMVDTMQQQQKIQAGQELVANSMGGILSHFIDNGIASQKAEETEEINNAQQT